MKLAVSAKQIVHFRKSGHVQFLGVPFPSTSLEGPRERDLWRKVAPLKRWIQNVLAPIVFELTDKQRLRLACDQRFTALPPGRLQDFFCFQGLVCICVLSKIEDTIALDIFEPSNLTSKVPETAFYLVAIGLENCLLINNAKDKESLPTRNLGGYVFGDKLSNEFHPLLIRS